MLPDKERCLQSTEKFNSFAVIFVLFRLLVRCCECHLYYASYSALVLEGCIHTSLIIPSIVNAASLLLNTVVIIPMNTVLVWIVAYLCSFSFRQSHGCA